MKDIADFTATELAIAAAALVTSFTYPEAIAPASSPRAILLGGQSGAGKTALHDIVKAQLDNNAIVIDGDEYRSLHPRFPQLKQLYGDDYVTHTALWAGRMTESLVDHLSRFGYNLIVEGTLRTATTPTKTAELLVGRGYEVSLALMAVKPEISLISCQLRYEQMRVLGITPRATDPAHHKKTVDQIVANLETLESCGLFADVSLYTRARQCIYPREGFEGTAADALSEKLFGPWSHQETEHYRTLQCELERLREQ